MKAINIIWDTDGENVRLPNEIEIPNTMIELDAISDYITDETGFCHKGFELDYDGMEIYCPYCGKEIVVEFNTARCEECGWSAFDAELDDLIVC